MKIMHVSPILMQTLSFLTKISMIAIPVVLSACAEIAPWERGILAKSQMALEPHPLQRSVRGHAYGSREAGGGESSASGGGGCGCY